jgi:hypothetical protein
MDQAVVYVAGGLFMLAGVLAVRVYRLQRAERLGVKNPDRVPFEAIKARVEQERAIEWPTASHLQRHGEQTLGAILPAVRVPPYVLPYLASTAANAPRRDTKSGGAVANDADFLIGMEACAA